MSTFTLKNTKIKITNFKRNIPHYVVKLFDYNDKIIHTARCINNFNYTMVVVTDNYKNKHSLPITLSLEKDLHNLLLKWIKNATTKME